MSHDNHSHVHDNHGHEHHATKYNFFDGGGVAAVGWIYTLIALGTIIWLVTCG
jgi:hypothetical protein